MGTLDYRSVAEARGAGGLRLVISRGFPAPWGFAARAIYELKRIPFTAVEQLPTQDNPELVAWTGHNSAPIAVLDEERARVVWYEVLMLAERLAPDPRLVPLDQDERTEMFGLAHEIMAEDGLGWNIRTFLFDRQKAAGTAMPHMLHKYASSADAADAAVRRINQVVAMLDRRLAAQQASGRDYLVGDALSAADIYWTAFSCLIRAFVPEQCETPPYYAALADPVGAIIETPLDRLIAHRDRIARDWLDLPLQF